MSKAVFITATDTGVGKTIISCALGLALKKRGIDCGIMKPFQCSGDDTDFLLRTLAIKDEKSLFNPYYAKEPISPYGAFKKERITVNLENVFSAYKELRKRHEFLIVEGAGGLLVPLKENYLVADLIRDLDIPAIIVARAGLGTLNHTLLSERYAFDYGIKVKGIIINGLRNKTLAERTNPQTLKRFLSAPLLGLMPFIPKVKSENGLKILAREAEKAIDLKLLLRRQKAPPFMAGVNGFLGRSSDLRRSVGTIQERSPVIYHGASSLKEEKPRTKKLANDDKQYLWHPFTQMKDWLKAEPLIIEEAKGCYLRETKGNWYLDGVSSLWVNVHGHRKYEIYSAIIIQLNKVAHSTLLGLGNIPSIELAKELAEIAPRGLNKVFYSDNGSTAVEIALKMAYQYWQYSGKTAKTKFIHLENSYHGDTIGAVSVGGMELFHKAYKNLLFDSYRAESPYCYRCPRDKRYPFCNFECLDKLKEILKEHSDAIAALIVEPLVQAAAGILVWPQRS